ncbi:MAG: gamma-glutamyltransferase family protein [Pseudomonadota bacterium]
MISTIASLTRPEITGHFGVATSTHWLASQCAMRMLELGGNAFDGACAAAFVLYIAEPHMNGPAGDVSILFQHHKDDHPKVLCGQGPAPSAARIGAFQERGLAHIPGTGLLAAAVPGAFDAWMVLLRDYGTLDLQQILEPALDYTQNGCPMAQGASDIIAQIADYAHKHWPHTADIFAPHGKAIGAGVPYRNPTLAQTWERILRESAHADRVKQIEKARAIWQSGFIAEEIGKFARLPHHDITGRANAGFLTPDDMAGFHAHYEDPVSYTYYNHTIYKCSSWSQGPALLQCLALLDHTDIADMDPLAYDFVPTITEAMKLCFADRDVYYGDPDFVATPLHTLLSTDYNAARAKEIGDMASAAFRPGNPDNHTPKFDAQDFYHSAVARQPGDSILNGFGGGEPTTNNPDIHKGDTCHIDVIDRWGNMVSATPSGGWLQSSPIIGSLGFCLGTRLQMCWLDENSPSSLHPGKRPRTTLTPTLVHRNDHAYMACGTPGGDQQEQWQLIFLLRHIHGCHNLQQAIDMPAWHCEHWPSSFYPRHAFPKRIVIEDRFSDTTRMALQKRGHELITSASWSEGRLSAATRSDGLLRSAANPRGMQGYAVGR